MGQPGARRTQERRLRALAAEVEGKAKVISQHVKKYMDSLVAAYTIKGSPANHSGRREVFRRRPRAR
ncbi:MAG: hypothetical protein QXR19_16980 [Candidatus Jordarchaeaceae archaeon]